MTPDQIRKSADLQNSYSFEHALGYKVPKYVTVVARKKGEEDIVEFECYMISDQGQALERDNCFGHSKDKKAMVLRQPDANEMMPSIITAGKPVKEFPPDFFLVSLAYGQPAESCNFNIMKIYDFPVKNRESPATPAEFSGYMKKYAAEPSERMFSNFQLLLYLSDLLDLDTAIGVA